MVEFRSELFEDAGASFLISPENMLLRWSSIRAILFDWDGVFNDGTKAGAQGSPFSEPDSMGINMLRFLFWKQQKQLPICAIITGANNQTAQYYAEREHFNEIHLNCKDKGQALKSICEQYDLHPHEIMYCYDDILDLPIATQAGLSFLIRRTGSPVFTQYAEEKKIAHYVSGAEGGKNALREISEMLISLNDAFHELVEDRLQYEGPYLDYLTDRNSVSTQTKVFEVKASK